MSEICINAQCLVDDTPWLRDTKHGADTLISADSNKNSYKEPHQKDPCKNSVSGHTVHSNLCIDS